MELKPTYKLICLFLVIVFLLLGCAGTQVVEVEYHDTSLADRPYTPREVPAKWDIEHNMPLNGADWIGHILIKASSDKAASKVAPAEAAKFGADFYHLEWNTYYLTETRYDLKGITSSTSGGRRVRTITHGTRDVSVKAWRCELYRSIPDPKNRELALYVGFRRCISACVWSSVLSSCDTKTLKDYIDKGMDINCKGCDIPILYDFINCIAVGPLYNINQEDTFEKLKLMFDAGINPNIRIKKKVDSWRLGSYSNVIKVYKPPYPTVLKIVRDIKNKTKKKKELEFLTKIESFLVKGGAVVN
jgi:hypothetical protein